MATKMIEVVTDDITGKEDPSVRNVKFSFDGVDYEIDLNDKNYAKLTDALELFTEHARTTSKPKVVKVVSPRVKVAVAAANGHGRKPATMDKAQRQAIREWATKSGLPVGKTGRIKPEIIEAYEAAGGIVPPRTEEAKSERALKAVPDLPKVEAVAFSGPAKAAVPGPRKTAKKATSSRK